MRKMTQTSIICIESFPNTRGLTTALHQQRKSILLLWQWGGLVNGKFEIEKWTTPDKGQHGVTDITTNSKFDNVRPFVIRNHRWTAHLRFCGWMLKSTFIIQIMRLLLWWMCILEQHVLNMLRHVHKKIWKLIVDPRFFSRQSTIFYWSFNMNCIFHIKPFLPPRFSGVGSVSLTVIPERARND